jgi:hypothetical protein
MFKASDSLILAKVSEAVHEDPPVIIGESTLDDLRRAKEAIHAPWRRKGSG